MASLTVGGDVLALGAITLQAAGALTVRDTGALKSGAVLTLNTPGAFVNAGRLYGQESLSLHARSLTNSGEVLSDGAFRLVTTGNVTNEGRFQGAHLADWAIGGAFTNAVNAEVLASGANGAALTVTGTFTNAGALYSRGDWVTEAGGIKHTGAGGAAGQLRLTAGALTQAGSLAAGNELHLQLTDAFTNAGTVTSAGALTVAASGLTQTATGRLAGERLALRLAGGAFQNAGVLESSGDASLTEMGEVTNSGAIRVTEGLTLTSFARVTHQGVWEAGTLTLTAEEFVHEGQTLVLGTGDSTFTLARPFENARTVTSEGRLTLQAPSLTNDGVFIARDGLTLITADALVNRKTLASGGALTLRAGRLIHNARDAEVYAGGEVLIEGIEGNPLDVVRNVAGTIEAAGSLTLRAGEFHNEALIYAETPSGSKDRRWVTRREGPHAHGGYWWATDQWVTLAEEVVNSTLRAHQAIVRAGGHITIIADTWNETSVVSAGGDLRHEGSLTQRTHTRTVEGLARKVGRHGLVPYERCSRVGFWSWNCRTEYEVRYDIQDTRTAQSIETEEQAVWIAGGTVNLVGPTLTFGTRDTSTRRGEVPTLTATTDRVNVAAPGASRGALEVPFAARPRSEESLDVSSPTEAGSPLPLNRPLASALERLTRRLSPEGLFRFTPPSVATRYVVETRPELTDPKRLVGSAYLLERLGIDLEAHHRFVGDSLVTSRLLRAQVEGLGGIRTLALADDEGWQNALRRLEEGTEAEVRRLEAEGLPLTLGIGLTPAQVQRLRRDTVWWVEADVGGTVALVPQLYLAQGKHGDPEGFLAGGGLAGREVRIDTSTDLETTPQSTLFALERLFLATEGDFLHRGRLASGGSLTVKAGRSLTNAGGTLQSAGETFLLADGDLTHTGAENEITAFEWDGATQRIHRAGPAGTLVSGGDFLAVAGGRLMLQGSGIQSDRALTLIAGEDLTVGSVVERTRSVARSESGTRAVVTVSHRGSTLSANHALTLQAGRDVVVEGSDLTADRANLTAGRHLGLFATQDAREEQTEAESQGGLFGGDAHFHQTRSTRTHRGSTLAVQDGASLTAHRGNMLSEGAALTSEGTLSLRASRGTLGLLSVKDTEHTTLETNRKGLFWFSNKAATGVHETIRETDLTATALILDAAQGVHVTYRGTTSTQTTKNGKTTALTRPHAAPDWVKGAKTSTPVTLQALTEHRFHTQEQQQGMTGLASLVISAAVSAATGGLGGALTVGMGVGAASVTSAALTSLATQGAIGLINSGGDLGATLKGMSLTGVLTAGALGGLDAGVFSGKVTVGTRVLRAGARAGVRTVLTGTNLKDALALEGAGVVGEVGATHLGIAYKSGTLPGVLHKAAHGALGCVTGALQGDCASGAVGAVVGEVTAEAYLHTQEGTLTSATWQDTRRLGIALSRLAGGLATGALGGEATIGASSAENAAQHNGVLLFVGPALLLAELVDKGLTAYDAYQLTQALADGRTEEAKALAQDLAVSAGVEATLGSVLPGSMVIQKAAQALRDKGFTALANQAEGLVKGSDTASPKSPTTSSSSPNPPKPPRHTPSPPNTPEAQQQAVAELFDDLHTRQELTMGSGTYRHDGSPGGAKVFEGVSQDDIFQYFEDLTGQSLPEEIPLHIETGTGEILKGIRHTVQTPWGEF